MRAGFGLQLDIREEAIEAPLTPPAVFGSRPPKKALNTVLYERGKYWLLKTLAWWAAASHCK
jgi:hypothetical protein